MIAKFKDQITLNRSSMIAPSVKLTLHGTDQTLFLRFDTKDVLKEASYLGKEDIWLASMCSIITEKSVNELKSFSLNDWDEIFDKDQFYLDLKYEALDEFFFRPLELLKAALAIYLGEDHVYRPMSPIVCRCFGVREADITQYLNEANEPSVEDLAKKTKASSGCRSCLTQIKKWILFGQQNKNERIYKDKTKADWIIEIDYMLSCFPESLEWKMEVVEFKNEQVIISFNKDASQKDVEELNLKLQDFLGAAVDSDLSFLLFRSKHFSKA